jgi:hypothetical protein
VEEINIPKMLEDYYDLSNQINNYDKILNKGRTLSSNAKRMLDKTIERRNLLKQQLTDMGEL